MLLRGKPVDICYMLHVRYVPKYATGPFITALIILETFAVPTGSKSARGGAERSSLLIDYIDLFANI